MRNYFSRLSNFAPSVKPNSKVFQYLANIKVEKSSNKGYIFTAGKQPINFGEFTELETPNEIVAQIIYLEWIKHAHNQQKLNFDNELKGILAEATDLKQGNISKTYLKTELIKYLDTDTLLYWESEGNQLRSKQETHWGIALDKISASLNIPTFQITDTLFEIKQDELVKRKFEIFLDELDHHQLAGFSHLVKATKSAILSWGLFANVFTPDEVVKLSLLELGHQAEIWGNRREYHEYSEIVLKKKVLFCNLFLKSPEK